METSAPEESERTHVTADGALSPDEDYFRRQYKAGPTPTYSWRVVGDDLLLQDYNDAAVAFTAGRVRDWSGTSASVVFAEYPSIVRDLKACAIDGRTIRHETLYRQPGVEQERTLVLTYVSVPVGTVMLQTDDVTDRKHVQTRRETLAKDALRQQAAMFDLAPVAIIALDLDRRVTYWNRGAQALYGWSAEESRDQVAHNLLQTTFPDLQANVVRTLLEVSSWEGELKQCHRDGTRLIVSSRQAVQRDSSGRPTGILEINTDITERSRTAADLLESETRLRAILDNAPSIMFLKDIEGRYLSTNHAFERLFGPTADQARGKTDAELFEEPIAKALRRNDREVIQSKRPIQFEVAYDSDGARTSLVMKYPLIDVRGEPYAVGAIATDITEWKNLQILHEHDRVVAEQLAVVARLAEARDVYEAAARNLTDGLMILDRDDRVTFWNARLEELLGVTAGKAVGQRLADLDAILPSGVIKPDPALGDAAHVPSSTVRSVSARSAWQVDIGTGLNLMVLTFPIIGPDGQFLGHARLVRDVTHERAIDRLKDQFVSMVSHELRTPMNGVIGMTELLLETSLDASQREFAETIRDSGRALVVIVNDILDISRLQDGKVELEETDLDVRAVVEHLVELLIGPARRKGVELVGQVDRRVPHLLRGDSGRLRQVLANLVGNAIKFTDHGEVSALIGPPVVRGAELLLRCEVHDTGIGIEPSAIEHLFEPFKQADSSVTRRYGGTGLGLAICKRLVEAMGGEIGIISKPGQGSTFWFTVNLKQPTATVASSVPRSVQDLHVLIIDPQGSRRAALREQVAAWGVPVDDLAEAPPATTTSDESSSTAAAYDVVLLTTGATDANPVDLEERVKSIGPSHVERIVWLNPRTQATGDKVPGIWATLPSPPRRSQVFDILAEIADQKQEGVIRPPVSPKSHGPAPAASSPVRSDSPLVLVVDDVEVNRRVAERMLARLGYRSMSAESGLIALDSLGRVPCDAVLMDCRMPDMDGFTATAEIRRREGTLHHTPIIAMTAHANSSDRIDCLNAGMDDYLSKPVELAGLATMMKRWARDSHLSLATPPVPAPPPGPTPDVPIGRVLNSHALDQIRALDEPGQPSLLAEMVETFGTSMTMYLARLKETVPARDCKAVTEAAHALKGAAACIGAERVRAVALKLELVGRDCSLSNAPKLVAELEEDCLEALLALTHEVAGGESVGTQPAEAITTEERAGGR